MAIDSSRTGTSSGGVKRDIERPISTLAVTEADRRSTNIAVRTLQPRW